VPTEDFYQYKSGQNKGCLSRVCKKCTAKKKYDHDLKNPKQKIIRNKRFANKRYTELEQQYEDWFDKLSIQFKPMTEEQWLETCRYFNGCAICGSEHIETRQFFVPFEEGGKYAIYNMFPMCGECSKHVRITANPFLWLDKSFGTAKYVLGLTEERRQKLVNYLLSQIERCKNDEHAKENDGV
jgi:hypothetical protein